ncbi:MarR family transcriptional regulator [Geodermatophilus sp. YIM 151500]|uniref:MarR family winged helix-turn-helix transcriptional regulator n=1 Tax=Geodermatophilus sp. YIM 151500 TaxID=2984531 RepID=UPI0021E4E6D8|nr:MarR family transcriptional regulator [Geodermatophilus sp. YIM 151500]MCV2488409.1 MarR family transcriptional regulator [Geodermatophilus sp. YIM 151500]
METARWCTALDRVLELVVVLDDDMARGLARRGLTTARAHLLWELRSRGPVTQRVLAAALGVTPRNVTGLVDALVDAGLVIRAAHPTDRRATLVSFTDDGAALADGLARDREEFAAALFAGMPAERLTGLLAGLDDVLERLRERGVGRGAGAYR